MSISSLNIYIHVYLACSGCYVVIGSLPMCPSIRSWLCTPSDLRGSKKYLSFCSAVLPENSFTGNFKGMLLKNKNFAKKEKEVFQSLASINICIRTYLSTSLISKQTERENREG